MNIIKENFSEVIGKPCWGLKYDRQTNLTLNFGNPSLEIEAPFESTAKSKSIREHFASRRIFVKSEYFLWIYIARWKIIHNQITLATNCSSFLKITKSLGKLDGQILDRVEVNKNASLTRFDFDLGSSLIVQRWNPSEIDELWAFYKPDNYVLSIFSNGLYQYHLSTVKTKKMKKI